MPGSTPQYGWPYPIATDPLDDAVSVIPQSLATAMENTLATLFGGSVPGAGWTALALAANWSGAANQSRHTKYGSRVWVDAYLTRASSTAANAATVATLPAGYRPTATCYRPGLISTGGTLTLCMFQINTTGVVQILTSAAVTVAVGASIMMVFDFPTN